MRVLRSSSVLPFAVLALSILMTGCKGDAANETNSTGNAAPVNSAPVNSANNAPAANSASNGNSADNASNAGNAGNATANAAPTPTGPKVEISTTKAGTGAGAKNGDLLSLRYTGKLTNGSVFDSNATKDPFNLTLGAGGVIQGWEEGLQGIKLGEKRTLKIPAVKAYGAQSPSEKIPANSDLVFDIECLDLLTEADATTIKRETLRPGTGPAIKTGQTVTFNFRGTLADGKEFDSTYKAKPVTVKIGAGSLNPAALDDGIVGMKIGGKYRLKMPPQVAFGPQGNQAGTVPANSVVYFTIEPTAAK